jgi:excisionase family DNA binding protein
MSAVLTRPTLLDEKQAAEFLGVAPQTLSNWRCTDRYGLPFIRLGRSIRYRLDTLEKWLEGRTHTSAVAD